VYVDPARLQVMLTALGEGARALPEVVVTLKVASTVIAVPPPGVNVRVWVAALTAPLQPGAKVKVKFVYMLAEPTEVGDVLSTTGSVGAVAVTTTAEPAAESLIPTVAGVGPRTVSQYSVSVLEFATIAA
jgi:hypothetical protein